MTLLLALALLVPTVPQQPATGSVQRDALTGGMAPRIHADEWLPNAPDLKGKVVLLDFWATWCGPCIAQFPTMRQWKQRFGDELVIIGTTNLEGQTAEEIRTFLVREKLPWPVGIDNAGATHKAFGVVPLPHTFLIDKKGVVRAAHLGGRGFADLLPELETLLGEPGK